MRKIAVLMIVATAAIESVAMPSQNEISEVKPLVAELMKPSVSAFKAKKMSGSEVGDKALELAESASTEAAVFLCMRGAVSYYLKDKAYDKAADAIESIVAKFPDIPPETLHEITTSATKSISAKSAQRLFDMHRMASRRAVNARKLKTLKIQLNKTPADKDLLRRYAELTAASDNWNEALKNFAKLGGDMGKMAQDELDGNASAVALADFWWDYEVQEVGATDAIRQRAAMHYQSAIDSGALDGLKKVRAENRIAELLSSPTSRVDKGSAKDYMIVDLETGKVVYEAMHSQEASNKRYQDNKYKTRYLVLRRIPAGKYYIGGPEDENIKIDLGRNSYHAVNVSKDYYFAIYELTVAQYDRIMGVTPKSNSVEPKGGLSYDIQRGGASYTGTPTSGPIANLNRKTGLTFDCPTTSMFEIANRAGCKTKWILGDTPDGLTEYAWLDGSNIPRPVGTKKPNNWGIYDTIGNQWEVGRDAWNSGDLARLQPDPLVAIAESENDSEAALMGNGVCERHNGNTVRSRFSLRHHTFKANTRVHMGCRLTIIDPKR